MAAAYFGLQGARASILWEQNLLPPGNGGAGSRKEAEVQGRVRMDLSARRDIPEGGGKLPLLERASKCPVLGRLAFHLLQTLKAPASQSQFEINTLAHLDDGTEAGASHPSELPVPGPYLAHLAALGCFSPGVQAASGTFYCSAGKSQGWGLRSRSATWVRVRGLQLRYSRGRPARGAETATESAVKDRTGPASSLNVGLRVLRWAILFRLPAN